MPILPDVERELDALPVGLRNCGTAAVARAMAEAIDGGRGSVSECGKVLLQALETLRGLAPPKKERDGIDDLAKRRAERRAGVAKAADMPRS